MNSTKKCSLAGITLLMEEEAYQELRKYIHELEEAYSEDKDKAEILADIEARMAELLLQSVPSPDHVIPLPLTRNVIDRMGRAQDIAQTKEENENRYKAERKAAVPKRLYRDTSNSRLGGVISGLAHYFSCDVTLLRLCFVLPALLSMLPFVKGAMDNILQTCMCSFFVGYLVMWFVVPKAVTARQRLEMDGHNASAEEIAELTRKSEEERARQNVVTAVSTFSRVVTICLKILLCLLIFPLVLLMATCIALFFAGLFGVALPEFIPQIETQFPVLFALGVLLSATIPLGTAIYLFLGLVANYNPRWKWIAMLVVAWLIIVIMTIAKGVSYASKLDSDEVERIMKPATEKLLDSIGNMDQIEEPDSILLEQLRSTPDAGKI